MNATITIKSNPISVVVPQNTPTHHIKKYTMCIYDDTIHCSQTCPILKCYRVHNRTKEPIVSRSVVDLVNNSKFLNGIIDTSRAITTSGAARKVNRVKSVPKELPHE